MSMIKVENLTFSYPSSYDNIFENVSFQIDTDWKLGFTGRNGKGKTTFLSLLLNKYEYSGKITSSVEFDYFPYPVADKSETTRLILDRICPQALEWELVRELERLHADRAILCRPFETLSGGEQTKALLAALFLNDNHFLLIDEPTNNLDSEGRKLVSEYLNEKKGYILVSHDRRFLDGCVDHILSVNKTGIELQGGNFSTWFANFENRQNFEKAQNERLKKDIGRLKKAAGRTSAWSDSIETSKIGAADKGFVGHKSAKMMKRAKSLESRQRQAVKEKSGLLKDVQTTEELKLSPLSYHSETLAEFTEVAVIRGGRQICEPVSFKICRADRIALEGKNGSGKTSLLKLLLNQPLEHLGCVKTGSGLKVSYVSQSMSNLRGNLKDFAGAHNIDESLFKAILRKLDFERVQFEKDISDFSGGQKKKVLLAKSLCEKAHLYVWDEPLNFIDIYSRMQIERLITDFCPTMIFVEHDAAFKDSVATRIIKI